MLEIEIPGFGPCRLKRLVSDFTGTLSVDGRLLPGVRERLNKISENLKVHILTADTFGMVESELNGIDCELHILKAAARRAKRGLGKKLGAGSVIATGNGNNDRRMLKAARIGIAVAEGEGCSVGLRLLR